MKTVVLGIVVSTVKIGPRYSTVAFNEAQDFDSMASTFKGALLNHLQACLHILKTWGK